MPIDDFLRCVLRYEKERWQELLDSWSLPDDATYRSLRKEFVKAIKSKNEKIAYKPFYEWATYVISRAKKDKETSPLIDLVLHLTFDNPLDGEFGERKPDITGSSEKIQLVTLLNWAHSLISFEFKRDYERKKQGKRKGDGEVLEDSDRKPKKVSETKQRNSQAKKTSTTMLKGESQSRSQSIPIQPGYNRVHTPTPKVSTGASGSNDGSMNKKGRGKVGVEKQNQAPVEMIGDKSSLVARGSTNHEVQLANYAMQMLSSREFRTWTICALIDGPRLALWYYDRSHTFSSEWIDLDSEDDVFAKVILALSLCSGARENLGFHNLYGISLSESSQELPSSSIRYINARRFTPFVEDYPEDKFDVPKENQIPKEILEQGTHIQFNIDKPIHRQHTLLGRATRIEEVKVGKAEGGQFVSVSENTRLVLKVSYQVKTRPSESDIIKHARNIDPVHTPALLGYCEIDDLDLPGRQLERVPGISRPDRDSYEERRVVLLLMRYYEDVYDLKGEQFVCVFRQGVRGMNCPSVTRVALTASLQHTTLWPTTRVYESCIEILACTISSATKQKTANGLLY